MKIKHILLIAVIIIAIAAGWLIGSGFIERTNVYLADYSVSDDGTQITMQTGIAASMGYVRGFRNDGGGVRPHYLTFYSAFGGFNSKLGAKSEFTLSLDPDDCEIYFNRPDGGYQLVLIKDSTTGEWIRPES